MSTACQPAPDHGPGQVVASNPDRKNPRNATTSGGVIGPENYPRKGDRPMSHTLAHHGQGIVFPLPPGSAQVIQHDQYSPPGVCVRPDRPDLAGGPHYLRRCVGVDRFLDLDSPAGDQELLDVKGLPVDGQILALQALADAGFEVTGFRLAPVQDRA